MAIVLTLALTMTRSLAHVAPLTLSWKAPQAMTKLLSDRRLIASANVFDRLCLRLRFLHLSNANGRTTTLAGNAPTPSLSPTKPEAFATSTGTSSSTKVSAVQRLQLSLQSVPVPRAYETCQRAPTQLLRPVRAPQFATQFCWAALLTTHFTAPTQLICLRLQPQMWRQVRWHNLLPLSGKGVLLSMLLLLLGPQMLY